jgi:hypothetical protein
MPRRSPPERGSVRTSHRSQPQPHRKRPASTLLPAATGLQSPHEDTSPQRSVDQLARRHRAVIGSLPARDQRERRVLRRQALVPRECLDLQRDARLDGDVAAGNHQHGPTTRRRRRRRHQATCGPVGAQPPAHPRAVSPASDHADARALALKFLTRPASPNRPPDRRLQRASDTRSHSRRRLCSGRAAGAQFETAALPRKEKPRAPRPHGSCTAPSDD